MTVRIVRILAPNPGVRELEGTNTWIVGDAPAIVIDPGPDHEVRPGFVVSGRLPRPRWGDVEGLSRELG